jgi:hypothetical protein
MYWNCDDPAHEADMRELIREQLLADIGPLTKEELAEMEEEDARMGDWWGGDDDVCPIEDSWDDEDDWEDEAPM